MTIIKFSESYTLPAAIRVVTCEFQAKSDWSVLFFLTLYRIVSSIIFLLGLPVIALLCLSVAKWREGLDQKLGLPDTDALLRSRLLDLLHRNNDSELQPEQLLESKETENIWLHAVSFGEVKTIEPLVYALQEAFPTHKICLSTGTQTGQQLAQKLFSDRTQNPRLKKDCFVFYYPFDFYFAVKNWFSALKPKFVIVAETEIWPEFLFQCMQRRVPVFIVNGRLTDRSVSKYRLIKPLMQEALRAFKGIFVQSEADQKRFFQIGATEEQVEVLSNMKFDALPQLQPERLQALKAELNLKQHSRVLIAGSTHKGEEELACQLYVALLKRHPNVDLRLIIAPRHLERLNEVEDACKTKQLQYIKRSDGTNNFDQVLILDTLGELNLFYGISQIALLGGTWTNVGGHNPLEAALYGIPIFAGPHTHKITDLVSQLEEMRLMHQISELTVLLDKVSEIIGSSSTEEVSRQAQQLIKEQMGAVRRSVELIKHYLD